MYLSRPLRPDAIAVTGATEGDTLVYQEGAFRPTASGDAPTVSTDAEIAIKMPTGKARASWAFVATAEKDGEVYSEHGTIDAWLLDGQSDVDGRLQLAPVASPPGWAEDPVVDGAGDTMTLTLAPDTAAWRTTLRLLDAS